MAGALETWEALSAPWRAAFEEAWLSWTGGSFGIGAVLAESDGSVVARGRNRVLEPRQSPDVLAETLLAHAEMNALLDLPIDHGTAAGLTLFTTVEPCLMCTATIVAMRVSEVRYAAADTMFEGTHDAMADVPYCVGRMPERQGPLPGPLGALAFVLPLAFARYWKPTSRAVEAYARALPTHVHLADKLLATGRLGALASEGADVCAVLDELWRDLVGLTGESA
jgi:tRNA(adenine34) deaminase